MKSLHTRHAYRQPQGISPHFMVLRQKADDPHAPFAGAARQSASDDYGGLDGVRYQLRQIQRMTRRLMDDSQGNAELHTGLKAILEAVGQLDEQIGHIGDYAREAMDITEDIASRQDGMFMLRLRQTVEDHLAESGFCIDRLAELMGMSRTSLNRYVRRTFGTLSNEYIKSVRLEKAACLLSCGTMKVNEICYKVGFSTPSYFTKSFVRKYGMKPSEWVAAKRKEQDSPTVGQ